MSLKLSIYNKLVNEVPGIREKYNYYKQSQKSSALKAYAYLGYMNFQYHILHRKSVGELKDSKCDEKICIYPEFTESALIDYGTPAEFADRLMHFDVISFDVFDTLVFRPFKNPTDSFYFLENEFKYPGLKSFRIEAEKQARINKQKVTGNSEVNLTEIWQELELTSGIPASEGMSKELMLEKKYCFANPFFVEVLSVLKKQHKKLIICSDMYLGNEYIKEILASCGYDEFSDYIVSSDYGKSKSDGSLYEAIKDKYGEEIVHIGDNPHSDIKMAEKRGISTVYYANVNTAGKKYRPSDMSLLTSSVYAGLVNSHLYNGAIKKNWEYEFGFIYGGLLVTGYCKYIHQYVHENNIDKLLFLSRDGDVICKAYKFMYPEEAEKCEYVLWSRLVATRLCAKDYKHHYMARMIDYKIEAGYTIAELFKTMDLEVLAELFEKKYENKISLSHKLNKENAKELKAFLNKHWENVINQYEKEKDECINYYEHILSGCRNALAIDSGWMGSGAIMLNRILKNTGCNITGMLIGTLSAHSNEKDSADAMLNSGDLVSFCFSSSLNRDIWKLHDASKGHNLIVELLLSSDQPSFRGFKKDVNGFYSFNNSSEIINCNMIQEGIMDFVKLFNKCFGDEINISGRDAIYPVTILYKNKKWVEDILQKTGINTNIE